MERDNETVQREGDFRESREYRGDYSQVFDTISKNYNLGEVKSSQKVETGYEDDNHILDTEKGKFFVKIFGGYRDLDECKRYVGVIEKAVEAGVSHPKMFQSENGSLYSNEDLGVNLAVFKFIEGQNFYETGEKPTEKDAKEIIEQAAKINSIDYKPSFVYDSWAITSIAKEYEVAEPHLSEIEKEIIGPLVSKFKEIDLGSLPHSLVHGDIIATNVMKAKDGKIYICDFACANYYPRIMELALLKCNLLSDVGTGFLVQEYQKYIELTEEELKALPLFIDFAHAMHVIGATREKALYGNNSDENEYWLGQGRKGLNIKV